MRLRFSIIFICLLLALATPVLAQENMASKADRCALAQSYLKNIQKPRDLRARVDRLQAYQYIYQRLDKFVIRLEKNNQPQAKELRAQLNQLNGLINNFKASYESYDQSRESVSKLQDCRNHMDELEQRLNEARLQRQAVYDSVQQIQTLLRPAVVEQLTILHQSLLAEESNERN